MTGGSNLNTTITGLIAGATYSISVAANSNTLPSYARSTSFTIRKCVSYSTATSHIHSRTWLCFMGYMVSHKGVLYSDHDPVAMSNVGSNDSSAIICYTNYSDVHGSEHEGNWISPDGTRVDSSGSVPGFRTTRGPLTVRLLRTSGTPQQGIYRCVVQNDTAVLYTVHVGLYNSGEGIVLTLAWLCVYGKAFNHHLYVDTGHSQLSGGVWSLIVSSPSPVTTVTWTRYSHIFTTGNETVLDNPVTAQYTHTLIVTGRGAGRYTCTVANKVSPYSSADIVVRGKKTECDTFYFSF